MPNNQTARKFGIEMERYINSHPERINIPNARIKRDGSLRNSDWENSFRTEFGVEIVSNPIRNLEIVSGIYGHMGRHGWHVDNCAGTHVHIDIDDYSGYDKAKLLRFCKGIERIIFMFVKDYRNENRYCRKLSDDWKKIFKPVEIKRYYSTFTGKIKRTHNGTKKEVLDLRHIRSDALIDTINDAGLRVENSKYFWLNIYGSRHGTAEFRLFHAVENWNEIKNFILMAHNIVELAKNSTPEQLEFIILSLYESESVDALKNNFFQVVGLSQNALPIVGENARIYIQNKLQENRDKRAEEVLSQLKTKRTNEKLLSLMRG